MRCLKRHKKLKNLRSKIAYCHSSIISKRMTTRLSTQTNPGNLRDPRQPSGPQFNINYLYSKLPINKAKRSMSAPPF
jgi:hypothetical protein